MGEYGVQTILTDPELQTWGKVHVLCASDPVGVVGAVTHFRDVFRLPVDVVTGPATDNHVGTRFVESLGIPAINARTNPNRLGDFVLEKVRPHLVTRREY